MSFYFPMESAQSRMKIVESFNALDVVWGKLPSEFVRNHSKVEIAIVKIIFEAELEFSSSNILTFTLNELQLNNVFEWSAK